MIITDNSIIKNIFGADYYDGSILHQRFAYKVLRDKVSPYGDIIAFKGKMEVIEHLIDQEDALNKDYIWSDDAINFCWESPLIKDHFSSILFQRLFNQNVAGILSTKYINAPIEVDGDDLMVIKEHKQGGIIQPKGKCSVSIACMRDGSGMGHLGINIRAGEKAPAFAYSTNLTDMQSISFMNDVTSLYYNMIRDIFVASTKVI